MSNGVVIPGVKYGIYVGQLLPSCRSIETMLNWLAKYDDGECEIKLHEDITDDDCCQRGIDGMPLYRLTPLVPFCTRDEWLGASSDDGKEDHTDRKSFLAWRWEQSRTAIVADSKFGDDSSPLAYVVLWSATDQRWRATFEGACVCLGALIDCMNACEDEERCHDDAV